jgi:hypothetical protein
VTNAYEGLKDRGSVQVGSTCYAPRFARGWDEEQEEAWCDTYVDPGLFLHLESVVLDFGSINGNSLTRGSQIIGAADGRPLPVLHLCERGWTRRVRGGRCYRHQKARASSALLQRVLGLEQGR